MSDAPPVTVTLRPITENDEPELRRIHTAPEVSRWWGGPEEGFPRDEPEATRLAIEFEGRVVGLIQFSEELEPRYRHAALDLFLDPAVHGRGIGPEALRQVVRHLVEDRGHHRVTIDPAATNTAAIRAYEKVGFRAVRVIRQYERDADGEGWHDGLLIELLAHERAGLRLRQAHPDPQEAPPAGTRRRRPTRHGPTRHLGRQQALRQAELELARQAETAYRRLVTDWQPIKGAGAPPGRASQGRQSGNQRGKASVPNPAL